MTIQSKALILETKQQKCMDMYMCLYTLCLIFTFKIALIVFYGEKMKV